ncbi:MAG: hypothetical protein RBS43_04960 [Candidatus Cloacimonas sp.]|jgi:hypothetical protein|nr:hypothetical protein [Candidatus Cloacimonas sp.]
MKQRLVIFSLVLFLGSLFAQTQTLPDMKISGESGIKAYLYKRSLMFSAVAALGDSLPAFVPSGKQFEVQAKASPYMKHRSYVQFEGNTDFGLNSFISFYPKDIPLFSVSHLLELRAPESDLISIRNNLFISGELSSSLPLSFRFDQASAAADSFKTAIIDLSLAHHRFQQDFGVYQIQDLNLQFGYTHLAQDNLLEAYKRDYFDGYYSGIINSTQINAKTKLLVQAGEAGIQIAPLINWQPYGITRLRPHIIADAYRFVPSLEFQYRKPLSGGNVLTIGNEPLLDLNKFTSLLEYTPWIYFSDAHKLQKTPLNLKTELELIHPLSNNFSLSRLNICNTNLYQIHSPLMASGTNYGVAGIDFTEILTTKTDVDAFFKIGDLALHQSIGVELAYLPRDSYRRAPYRSAFNLDSRLLYPYRDWLFNLDLIQDYLTVDHLGNDLPEAIILNLGAEYRKDNTAVYGQLSNLFNQKQWFFNEQPAQGRRMYLGLKHRF